MKYKIVADSCCDLTADMKNWQDFEIVPLTLEIGEYRIFDDENFDQDDFISRMKANGGNAKELFSCPDIDGGLIGGASLDVEKFIPVIEGF